MVHPLSSTSSFAYGPPRASQGTPLNPPNGPAFGFGPAAGAFNLAAASASAMGSTGPAMRGVRQFMGTLENNFLAQLVVSDVLAMVLPRTAVEMKERGVVAAQETLFRELAGTLTNTIMAGWLGYGMALQMQKHHKNLRAMDTKTWIESNTLEHFGNLVQDILKNNKTLSANEVRRAFYTEALGRLDATDPIAKLEEYNTIFPNKGRLGQAHLQELTRRMMGESHRVAMPYNLEHHLHTTLNSQVEQSALKSHKMAVQHQFEASVGTKKLNYAQHKALQEELNKAEALWKSNRLKTLRLETLPQIRQQEAKLIENLYTYAVDEGQLSDKVFTLKNKAVPGVKGQICEKIGIRGLNEQLAAMVHFDREFLTRALADPKTGALGTSPVNASRVLKALFTPDPTGRWAKLRKNLPSLPKSGDGLITLAYRAKLWTVVLPVAFTALAGMLTVTLNNWITQNRFHGQKFFPGEQVFVGNHEDAPL